MAALDVSDLFSFRSVRPLKRKLIRNLRHDSNCHSCRGPLDMRIASIFNNFKRDFDKTSCQTGVVLTNSTTGERLPTVHSSHFGLRVWVCLWVVRMSAMLFATTSVPKNPSKWTHMLALTQAQVHRALVSAGMPCRQAGRPADGLFEVLLPLPFRGNT